MVHIYTMEFRAERWDGTKSILELLFKRDYDWSLIPYLGLFRHI